MNLRVYPKSEAIPEPWREMRGIRDSASHDISYRPVLNPGNEGIYFEMDVDDDLPMNFQNGDVRLVTGEGIFESQKKQKLGEYTSDTAQAVVDVYFNRGYHFKAIIRTTSVDEAKKLWRKIRQGQLEFTVVYEEEFNPLLFPQDDKLQSHR